jgi:hypothetical protein
VLSPVREGLHHTLDVFGWMDALGLKLRYSVRHQQE